MARLWTGGAELNSATDGVEITSTDAGTNCTVQTGTVRSGTYAWRAAAGAARDSYFQFTAVSDNQFFGRVYVYVAAAPTSNARIIRFIETGVATRTSIIIKSDRTLILVDGAGTQIGSPSSALSLNTWYMVDLMYDNNDPISSMEARLEGSAFATTILATTVDGTNAFAWGNTDGDATLDIYFDDVAINDTSGSAQTSYPGSGKVVRLLPTAAGDSNTWLKSGGGAGDASNYQDMDEVTPDDVTTYLKRTTTTVKVDDYNVTDSATAGIGSTDTITLVQVGIRGGAISATASTDRDVLLRIKSAASGTTVKSANSTNRLNINGWTTNSAAQPKTYKLTSYTDPTTAAAWTPTGTNSIDNMQIGVENQTSVTTEVRVTTLWAMVEYVPGAAPPPTTSSDTLLLMGV